MPYWVYLLANRRNGTLYVGVTNDLVRRVHEHRAGVVRGFTQRYGVKQLVWFDQTASAYEAIRREKQIKTWHRAWKLALTERTNPHWDDLYETLVLHPPPAPSSRRKPGSSDSA